MRLKVALLLSTVAILTQCDFIINGRLVMVTVSFTASDSCTQTFNTSFSSPTAAVNKTIPPCSNHRLPPANVKVEQLPDANQYPKLMSWDWFWESLTEDQKNSYEHLSQEEKDALWAQKRVQFEYSTKRIPGVLEITPPNEIPQILHFIYVSPGLPSEQPAIPDKIIGKLDKWQEMHPGYLVVLWRNKDIIDNFPNIHRTLQSIPVMAWAADILRYFVMDKFGGIYFDSDMIPLRSIESIRKDFGPFFGTCEWNGNNANLYPRTRADYVSKKKPVCWMNNNVIGGIAHNPAFREAMDIAIRNTHKTLRQWTDTSKFRPSIAGPKVWREVAGRHQVTRLTSAMFQLCGYRGQNECNMDYIRQHPHIYTLHEFEGGTHKYARKKDPLVLPYNASLAEIKY